MTSIQSDRGTVRTDVSGKVTFSFTAGTSEHFRTAENYANFLKMLFNIQSPGQQALWFGWQIWKETNNEQRGV